MVDHVIIPDAHAVPGENPRRFIALGNYLKAHKPDVIVNIGDWWDMHSLCSYDKGKKDFVLRSISDDLEVGHAAEELAFGWIPEEREKRLRGKRKQYDPLCLKVLGNHEYRLKRLLDYDPRLEGPFSMDDFNTRLDINEEIIPYLDHGIVDNIAYSHFFVSGVQGRACASANAMINKKGMSCTMGHTHVLDHAIRVKPTGEMFRGLICGSFHDPDHVGFAGAQVDAVWWNGIIHKRNVKNGSYDLEEISVEQLLENYL